MTRKKYRVKERDLTNEELSDIQKHGPLDVRDSYSSPAQYESSGKFRDFGTDKKTAHTFAKIMDKDVDTYYRKQKTNRGKKKIKTTSRRKK
jgi:hypothetical protein